MIKKLLEEKKINRVLLTNHFIKIFSGSELVTFDIAKTFKQYGIEVVCATFIDDFPLIQLFQDAQIPVVNLIHNPQRIYQQDFDLIWSHHWPVLGYCLNELKIRGSFLITSSLSAYEPLEIVSLTQQEADLILFNAPSTKAIHIEQIKPEHHHKTYVLNNSLTSEWFQGEMKTSCRINCRRIAIISNHIAPELIEAVAYFQSQKIEIDLIGLEYSQEYVTPKLIDRYDLIITIGHSVQKCLARGVPVYCYDRFGGPGWILSENIKLAEFHNFSGRCCFRQLTSQKIAQEILDGYTQAMKQVDILRSIAKEQYSIEQNISQVLALLPKFKKTLSWEQKNTDFRKLSQLYLRSKFNVVIPPLVNIHESKSKVVILSTRQTKKEIWQKYFAYFALDKISNLRFEVGQKFYLRGIALGKDAEHRIVEIKLQNGAVCLTKSQLGLYSPGLGKQYPHIPFAYAGRFAIQLPKLPDCDTVSLNIKLMNDREYEMATIDIARKRQN